MATINAQSIINEVRAAALVAPIECPHAVRAAAIFSIETYKRQSAPWGFELEHFAEHETKIGEAWTGHRATWAPALQVCEAYKAARLAMDDETRAELLESVDAVTVPRFITFKVSERGTMKIKNLRAYLERFADTVKTKAAFFGGGLDKPAKRAAPAITWPAQALKVARELMQENDYAGALDLGAEKLGALYYVGAAGRTGATTFSIYAPVPCEAPELAGLHSAMHEQGHYVVLDLESGAKADGRSTARTRAGAIENAIAHRQENPGVDMARAIAKSREQYKHIQAEALALWKTERGIVEAADIEAQAAATMAAMLEAAQDAATQASEAAASGLGY